jgi:hypothetical protein
MGMVIAVLTVLVVCVALIVTKIVPVLAGVVLMVIGLIAVVAMAERRDRTRQRGIHDASQRLDANRASIPASLELAPGDQLDTYADVRVAATLSDRTGSRPPSD